MKNNSNSYFKKTDTKIQNAMLELLKKRKFTEISIKDICKEAKINRTSFYNHYADINDLMIKMEESLTNTFKQVFDYSSKHSKQSLIDFFKFIQSNKSFYVAFINNNYDFALSKRLVYSYIESNYSNNDDTPVSNNELFFHELFFDAGILAISKYWIKNGMKESVNQIVDLIYKEYESNYHFE